MTDFEKFIFDLRPIKNRIIYIVFIYALDSASVYCAVFFCSTPCLGVALQME
ncbi:hypothetical protein [Duncaniella dubosii]|uniref:hypothetical protein n=1 Tax=Duncaniella dubosii TaxID=2518971 RepID=UPI0037443000